MRSFRRLGLLSFQESLATIFVERGIYFFTHDRLGYGDVANLWLSLGFGGLYVVGALASHHLSRRTGERRLLGLVLAGQLLLHAAMAWYRGPVWIFASASTLGLLHGLKWPLIESFVSAGQSARDTARSLGRFSLCWASAVPISLGVSGWLTQQWEPAVFAAAAGINALSLLLVTGLAPRPAHLSEDDPQRPSRRVMPRLRALLGASRWFLLLSYATMWILAALLPGVLADLVGSLAGQTAVSGLLDVGRVAAFAVLVTTARWHGKAWPIALAGGLLVPAFALCLWGPGVVVLIAAEVAFGLVAGMIYYAALYYAAVVKNAAVEAGGVHEALIGAGFTLGPLVGMAGVWLAPWTGGKAIGVLVALAPLAAVCLAGAGRNLLRLRKVRPLA